MQLRNHADTLTVKHSC